MIKGIEDIINSAVKALKRTSKRVILPAVIGLGLFAGTASTLPGFDGKVWRGSYGTPADSANIILYNPHGPDTAMAKVGRFSSGYWSRAPSSSWGLLVGDTVRMKIVDINGDSANTLRNITFNGNNRVVDMYPAGHSLLVRYVWDSVDSANAKCFVKGKQDTLRGRFDINSGFWDISFNAANFPLRSRPVYGDSIKIEAWEGSLRGSTQGRFINEFIDADTLPSFNLVSGVYEEVDKHDRFVGDLRITPNPFTSFATLPGHEGERFSLYDVSGRQVGTFRGDRVGEGLKAGVYFLRYQEMLKQVQHDEIVRIVKVR